MRFPTAIATLSVLAPRFGCAMSVPIEARNTLEVARALSQDPEDYSWIKNWAAIGDSFTAGIGAGNLLSGADDVKCSRYDRAAAELINQALGPGQRKYQFLACSGVSGSSRVSNSFDNSARLTLYQDTSAQIRNQIKALGKTQQDLILVSAGGNDVGFGDVLRKCVYLPYAESACNDALKATQDLIDNNLGGLIDALLKDLDNNIAVNRIAVYTKYAKFFNATTDACENKTWTFLDPTGSSGLKLTKDRRKQMNDMVDSANLKIQTSIDFFNAGLRLAKMRLVIVDWDSFVGAT